MFVFLVVCPLTCSGFEVYNCTLKLAPLMVVFERKIDAFISSEVPWIGRKPEQKGENRMGFGWYF